MANIIILHDVFFYCKNTGTLASGMSHRRAWQYIVDNKLDVGVIMEDDVRGYFEKAKTYYKTINKIHKTQENFLEKMFVT